MDRTHYAFVIASLAIVATAATASAAEHPLTEIDEGFEDPGYGDRWEEVVGEGAETEIVNSPVRSGENAFHVTTGCGETDDNFQGAALLREVSFPEEGEVEASTWVVSHQQGTWGVAGLIAFESHDRAERAVMKIGADNGDDEVFGYRVDWADGDHEERDIGTWESEGWYKLSIAFDVSEKQMTFEATSAEGATLGEATVDDVPIAFDVLRIDGNPGAHRGTCQDQFTFDDIALNVDGTQPDPAPEVPVKDVLEELERLQSALEDQETRLLERLDGIESGTSDDHGDLEEALVRIEANLTVRLDEIATSVAALEGHAEATETTLEDIHGDLAALEDRVDACEADRSGPTEASGFNRFTERDIPSIAATTAMAIVAATALGGIPARRS